MDTGLTVFYGLCGEGLGHVRRAAPVLEHLRKRAKVVVLTSGTAIDAIRPQLAESGVEVRKVPGYRFEYNSWGRLSIRRTLIAAQQTARSLKLEVRALANELRRQPSAVISDFEPITIHAANLCRIPSLSVDHQRLIQACSFERASSHVRLGVEVLRPIIDTLYGVPQRLVISGFFLPPVKQQFGHAQTAGVTIRDTLRSAERRMDPYLLAYVRRDCPAAVQRTFERSQLPVYLYGMGKRPRSGNLFYCASSHSEFSSRLAGCTAVITTAGNQLIGEAFFLGKPVFAFPEPGNPEQHVNAWLLEASGGGTACSHREFSPGRLEAFLNDRAKFEKRLSLLGEPGNSKIIEAIDEFVEEASLEQRHHRNTRTILRERRNVLPGVSSIEASPA